MKNEKSSSSNVIWKFLERILAQLVTTTVTIVLARILVPDDYGVVAILMIFINFFNILATHAFSSALIQKKNADPLDFSSAFYSNLILTALLYAILFFLAPVLENALKVEGFALMLRVLGIRIPLASINCIQSAYISKNMQFKKYFLATLTGTVISAFLGIFMAKKGYGAWALIVQYLSNVCIDTLILYFTSGWKPQFKFSLTRAFNLFKYSWKVLVSALLDEASVEVKNVFITAKYSTSDLAFYNKGKQYPKLINTNVNESVSSVMFPAMSLKQDNPVQLKDYIKKSLKLVTFVMFPMLFGLAAVSYDFVLVLLTEKWLPAVPFMMIMCASFLFTPFNSANHQCIKAIGKSNVYLYLNLIKFIISVGLVIVAVNFGTIYIAISGLIATFISSIINSIYTKKVLNIGFLKEVIFVLPNLVCSLIMFAFVYLFSTFLSFNIILKLIIEVIIGIIIYVCLSLILNKKTFLEFINIAKRIVKK